MQFPAGERQWLSVMKHPGAPGEPQGKLLAAWRLDAGSGSLTALRAGGRGAPQARPPHADN
jgi:hypothetical protein